MWYDKFAADAFVDAYGAINWNAPLKGSNPPTGVGAGSAPLGSPPAFGGNTLRALDLYQGFAVNWAGVNVAYTADPIGFTVGARVGPGAVIYHTGTPDEVAGLQYVKQAYATWKATSALTLDFGKWDQPYGSEVADSQLNMNYTRSVLWWYMQPLWFTGLRANYAISGSANLLLLAANGWNNSIDNLGNKTFGGQLMLKPMDSLTLYLGYVGGSQQPNYAGMGARIPGAASNWRHMIDVVADYNPTAALRLLLNVDWRAEDNIYTQEAMAAPHSEIAYGGNLVVRYNVSDAFNAALRGEFFHDEHSDLIGTKNVEDATLTLTYGLGTHLAFMLDGRLDFADDPIFPNNTTGSEKTQFTTTLGVIASTK